MIENLTPIIQHKLTYWAVNNEAAAIAAKFWRTLRLIAILSDYSKI